MGFEHVVPQFALRVKRAAAAHPTGKVPFEIQGDGSQTRSFCHVDDLVQGVLAMRAKGEHLGIYHVGTLEEVTIGDVARRIAAHAGREIEFVVQPAPAGGTAAALPGHRQARETRLRAARAARAGTAADRRLVLGQRGPCAEALNARAEHPQRPTEENPP